MLRDFKECRCRERNSDNSIKTQFAVIRFEAKHDGDRTNVNIRGYDVNNVTRSRSTTKYEMHNVQNSKHLTDSVELRRAN